jgi:hypothetical protein
VTHPLFKTQILFWVISKFLNLWVMIMIIMIIIILVYFLGAFQKNSKPGDERKTHFWFHFKHSQHKIRNLKFCNTSVGYNQLEVATGLKSLSCLSVTFWKRCKLFAKKTKRTGQRMTATNIPAWDWLQRSNSRALYQSLGALFASGYLNQCFYSLVPYLPICGI